MNPHSIRVLEYSEILRFLAEYASSDVARVEMLAIQPSDDVNVVARVNEEVVEFRSLQLSQNPPRVIGPADIMRSIEKSRILGSKLFPLDLLQIAKMVQESSMLQKYFTSIETAPNLKEKTESITSLPIVHSSILHSIDDSGAILDAASPDLARIRRGIRKLSDKIRSRMDSIAVELFKQGLLQDPLVMIRNDRFVLPVKSGELRAVQGVVHDKSSSGATIFVEPAFALSENNELTKLRLDEKKEEDRILKALTSLVGSHADSITTNYDIILEFDIIQAKARMANEMNCHRVTMSMNPVIKVYDCRNPLLVLHRLFAVNNDPENVNVIPIDLELNPVNRVMVITGPNTGGKTVVLKTIGLMVLMHQSGIQLPCSPDSSLSIFKDVYADIGDEQSLIQSLSTFSGHLKNIVSILAAADKESLVLLDELGAGTDPAEGSALGITILSELLRRQTMSLATTHHNSIKAFAFTTEGIANAAVEFDIKTLRPTYRISMGRIGQSNALYIAERMGFPRNLLEEARGHLAGLPADLERMLQIVEKERQTAERIRQKADGEKERARNLRKAREDVLDTALLDARKITEEAVKKSESLMEEIRKERDSLRDELKAWRAMKKSTEKEILEPIYEQTKDRLDQLDEKIEERKKAMGVERTEQWIGEPPRVNEQVFVTPFMQRGKVVAIHPGRLITIDMEGKRVKAPLNHIRRIAEEDAKSSAMAGSAGASVTIDASGLSHEPIPLRLNLIGMTVDEAIDELETYIDKSYRAGISEVTVIHGFGTGRLMDAVVKFLKKSPFVESGRRGKNEEGGGGVTIVRLMKSE